ncbi:MAG: CsbD family protein [Bdellovibrionota bacterium]
MNNSRVNGKWNEIKGEIQKTWGKITGDELEQTKGDSKAISGLLEQRYGIAKDEASTKLSSIFDRFSDKVDAAKDDLRRSNDVAADKADRH